MKAARKTQKVANIFVVCLHQTELRRSMFPSWTVIRSLSPSKPWSLTTSYSRGVVCTAFVALACCVTNAGISAELVTPSEEKAATSSANSKLVLGVRWSNPACAERLQQRDQGRARRAVAVGRFRLPAVVRGIELRPAGQPGRRRAVRGHIAEYSGPWTGPRRGNSDHFSRGRRPARRYRCTRRGNRARWQAPELRTACRSKAMPRSSSTP